MAPPPGLTQNATMGDQLGDVTGIIDFDFTDRKLFVTGMEPGGFVNGGIPVRETTALGDDDRSLTVATFNVENLDPGDGAARFTALANAIATNLNMPDIISIEEMQDNNGATNDGTTDASVTWQMLVDALNAATGAHYQWVDQAPVNGAEGGEPGGNIRVGFLYNTDRVQLGDLDANATLAERRMYTDRIGDGVRDAGDLIAFDDSMIAGEINVGDWSSTRRSLLGEFKFNGNTVYVTANHLTAKGGSGEFWQFDQDLTSGDPLNAGWAKRNEQAQDVYSMLNLIQIGQRQCGHRRRRRLQRFLFLPAADDADRLHDGERRRPRRRRPLRQSDADPARGRALHLYVRRPQPGDRPYRGQQSDERRRQLRRRPPQHRL